MKTNLTLESFAARLGCQSYPHYQTECDKFRPKLRGTGWQTNLEWIKVNDYRIDSVEAFQRMQKVVFIDYKIAKQLYAANTTTKDIRASIEVRNKAEQNDDLNTMAGSRWLDLWLLETLGLAEQKEQEESNLEQCAAEFEMA